MKLELIKQIFEDEKTLQKKIKKIGIFFKKELKKKKKNAFLIVFFSIFEVFIFGHKNKKTTMNQFWKKYYYNK